ncbi:MAG: hypothetical protein HXL29_02135, partial [Prevotellaceae bacterium]|nr:hypothetical protein [Prevotellaceae bacterium]
MIALPFLLSALYSTAAPHAVATVAAPPEHTASSAAQPSAPATPLAAAQPAPTGSGPTRAD